MPSRWPADRRTKSFSVVTSSASPATALQLQRFHRSRIGMMIGEESRAGDTRRPPSSQRGDEFLRPPDAGKGEDAACRAKSLAIRHQPRAQHRTGESLPGRACHRPSTITASARARPCATGSRKGPAGIIKPLPKPLSPSTTTSDRSLGKREILVAVIHHQHVARLAPPPAWRRPRGRAPRWWARCAPAAALHRPPPPRCGRSTSSRTALAAAIAAGEEKGFVPARASAFPPWRWPPASCRCRRP